MPAPGGAVPDEVVGLAVWLVDRCGVADRAEAALARRTGRRRSLSVRAVLAGLVCLALDDRPLLLSALTDLLYRRLSAHARRLLGIVGDAPDRRSFLARYRCVRYCFHALCSTVDPSPWPKNRCLTEAQLVRRRRAGPPAELEGARARLEGLANALLESSVGLLTPDERAGMDGSVGLDATPLPLHSRGPSPAAGLCASDPDGGWYVREEDRRGGGGARRTRKITWALEATIATTAQAPGAPAASPNLAVGMALQRPGVDPAGTGMRVLGSVRGRGHAAGWLGADRAYTAASPERFHLPARALGYTLVMDYRSDQLGVQANSGGAILVEGTWCCPAMPAGLIDATADFKSGAVDAATFKARIDARAPYRLRRKQGPDTDGYERFACPATGGRPAIICPLRPGSVLPRDGRMKVLDPPAEPPRVCVQTAVTIAPDVGARHRQALPFASEQWADRYATLRNTIEGFNGFVKDAAHESLADARRRRVRGIAAQTIFCSLLLVAANVRKIRRYRELVTAGAIESVARRARRRRMSLSDHRPRDG